MDFIFKEITNKKQYGSKRRPLSTIKWIVIHYTGNYNKGADAMAHFNYLQTATRSGSAHFYVDDKKIIQTIGDSRVAWSVADNQGHGKFLNGCTNSNSLSIEMCVNSDSDEDRTYKNVLELTKNLMRRFNIDTYHVCRHYDVSRKDCPHNFRANNWAKWWQFKEDIKKPIEWEIDLTKSSKFGDDVNMKREDKNKPSDWAKEDWKWAKEKGLTDGTNPGGNCTREQMVSILKRYDDMRRKDE